MRVSVVHVASLVAISLLASARGHAQRGPGQPPAAQYTVELIERDRWMHAREKPYFAPTRTNTTWIRIDSIAVDSTARERRLSIQSGRSASSGDPSSIVTGLDGGLRRIDGRMREDSRPPLAGMDTAEVSQMRLVSLQGGFVSLPAARAWYLVPSFHPPTPTLGARWIDTVNLATALGEYSQSLRGIRTSWIVGDTVVDGRTLWIVRDTMPAQLTERFLERERTLGAFVVLERRASGFIRGRYLYDPSIMLARSRTDSIAVSGTVMLTYPDRRRFTSTAKLERARVWRLYEPAELTRRQAALRARADSQRSGGVVRVLDQIERRLRVNDANLIDSLTRVWQASRDPDQRDSIGRYFRYLNDTSAAFRTFHRARVAAGDTSYMYEIATSTPERRTLGDVRFLLPLMANPGLALEFNVSRDVSYENTIYALNYHPPALERDTAQWGCEPEACRLLAQQWNTAREPRLRSVALGALATTDPARWRAAAIARIDSGDNVLDGAAGLIKGVGSTAPAFQHLPIPATGSDWRAWRDWMGIDRPDYQRPTFPGMPERGPTWMGTDVNEKGILFEQLATGRDIVGELKSMHASAQIDTAQVVLGRILAALDALSLSGDSLGAMVKSESVMRRTLAKQLLMGFRSSTGVLTFSSASAAETDSLQVRLITAMLAKRPAWRSVEEKQGAPPSRYRGPMTDASPNATHPIYLIRDSLSAAAQAALPAGTRYLSTAEWNAMSDRTAGEAWTVSRVERSGSFLRITVDIAGRLDRTPAQAPALWYSGTTFYLLEYDGEIVIASESAWVT